MLSFAFVAMLSFIGLLILLLGLIKGFLSITGACSPGPLGSVSARAPKGAYDRSLFAFPSIAAE